MGENRIIHLINCNQMINYVNNAFDKTLKPCDAQQFMTLTQSEQTEKLITLHRTGDTRAKAKLPAFTYMGVLDEERYKQYYRQCEEQGEKPLGSRRAEFMRPTGLLMMDYDHVIPKKVLNALSEFLSAIPLQYLALAHITPSGDGLRLVLRRTPGKTIAEEQMEWHQRIAEFYRGGELKFDDVCKDISRLSFAPMHKDILYLNPDILFAPLPNAADYPDGTIFSGVQEFRSVGVQTNAATDGSGNREAANGHSSELPATPELLNSPKTFETEYDGVSYTEIVKRLEEQLGGKPEHGARNSFIFTMACNLRYICNDDPAWIAQILPTYGEDAAKHRATVQSAVNRPMSRSMPETLSRALRIAAMGSDTKGTNGEGRATLSATPPAMPERLPEPMELLTSRTPAKMRPAVAMAVFPALGAHVTGLTLRYIDGRDYEPTFMNVLVAELSSGKSAVNQPIDYLIADIEARDEVAREKEARWKEQCATLKTTEDKPTRPKGLSVQVLSADMTNAAFVQRLADAEGKFLYTQMDEIELLDALRTNTRGGAVSAILRLAFDCGKYGQERVASNAINAKVRVRWNWNASTTIQRVRKYFAKSIADGTLSRLSFSTIIKDDDDWGEQRPVFGQYGEPFAEALRPYVDRLATATGCIVCPEAVKWAERMCDEQIAYARLIDCRPYAQLSFRSVLMGFFRAMLLYVMGGMQWSNDIAEFAAWTVKYDMWCKMRFFSDMLTKDMEGEREALQRGPVNLLSLLPQEFTKQQVQEVRVAQGMKPNPHDMLRQWVKRGFIERDGKSDVYKKKTA